MSARPYKPKDKSKAEVAVLERWILARLRHHTFFSLAETEPVYPQSSLISSNSKTVQAACRATAADQLRQLDKRPSKPCSPQPYRYRYQAVKVNIDYHVQYQQHHYSVPHQYVGERLELHASDFADHALLPGTVGGHACARTACFSPFEAAHMPTFATA